MTQFPRLIAASIAAEAALWDMADGLAAEWPVSTDVCQTVADTLIGQGYGSNAARKLCKVAKAFPPERRHRFSVRIHMAAGSPDVLDSIVRGLTKKGTAVTLKTVTMVMKGWRHQQRWDKKHLEVTS